MNTLVVRLSVTNRPTFSVGRTRPFPNAGQVWVNRTRPWSRSSADCSGTVGYTFATSDLHHNNIYYFEVLHSIWSFTHVHVTE